MNKNELVRILKEKYPNNNSLELFEILDRQDFIPGTHASHAYENKNISIGHFQHSLAPEIIIEFLNLLNLKSNDNTLEIGSGSGYLTACVYKKIIPGNIITIERIKELCSLTKKNLTKKFPKAIENKKIRIFWENGLLSPNKFLSETFDKIYITFDTDDKLNLDNFINLLKKEGIIVFVSKNKIYSYTKGGRGKPFLIEEKEIKFKIDPGKSGKC